MKPWNNTTKLLRLWNLAGVHGIQVEFKWVQQKFNLFFVFQIHLTYLPPHPNKWNLSCRSWFKRKFIRANIYSLILCACHAKLFALSAILLAQGYQILFDWPKYRWDLSQYSCSLHYLSRVDKSDQLSFLKKNCVYTCMCNFLTGFKQIRVRKYFSTSYLYVCLLHSADRSFKNSRRHLCVSTSLDWLTDWQTDR